MAQVLSKLFPSFPLNLYLLILNLLTETILSLSLMKYQYFPCIRNVSTTAMSEINGTTHATEAGDGPHHSGINLSAADGLCMF